MTNSFRTMLTSALVASLFTLVACASHPATTSEDTEVVLAFAVLGDAEPKPKAEFPGLEAAVHHVNELADPQHLDFVVGVGDIAHKGTLIQYENATPVLQQLSLPFYPIMGNEEHGSTEERYLEYANQWTAGKNTIEKPSYVLEFDSLAMVFASPDHGRDFDDDGIDWILTQLQRLQDKPVLLVVHAAQAGVYPERADKGVTHPGFAEVVAQPNLAAVISGDLHMDMDRVNHSHKIGQVHYLHIPALERTKIPDETRHTPMFRVFQVTASGKVLVETYEAGVEAPLSRHRYTFTLPKSPLVR
ncbi:metallophosphoesterase family protein [Marinimicrobium sp. ARAG 43.8]|uniref:metallophosphoesterase family protein n=1 Tax=Marinimicrobium sp. ARAG 43.8 TaxID=3418719 RepID=UPI003CF86775